MRNMQSTFRRENNLSVSFRVVLKPKKNNNNNYYYYYNKKERKLQKTLFLF